MPRKTVSVRLTPEILTKLDNLCRQRCSALALG